MVYSKYPDQIDSTNELPIAVDNQTFVRAESVNRLREAISKIENELGVKPSGTHGTVRARLDAMEAITGAIGGDTTLLSARLTDAEEAIDDLEAEVATLSGGLFIPETYGAIGNGIADDTAAWNACIAATSNGDVIVATSRAGYKITDEITVNKSIIIMGGGKIVQSGTLKGGFLVTTSNVTIKDLWIYNARGGLDWNPVGSSLARGIVLTTASGAKVLNCRIENWGESGIKLVSGLGIEIAGNTVIGIGAAGGLVGGSNNNIGVCADTSGALLAGLNIHDNDISQAAQGVFTGNDFIDLSIHNNRIHDIIGQLAIYADNASGLSITNNTCTATGGIKVQTASNATCNSEGIIVSNNIIDCLGGAAGDTIGIMITPGQVGLAYYHRDVSVCNNIIRNVAIDGIRVDQCEDYLIQGNIIENVGERGIRFGNAFGCTARNGIVRGNTIRSTNYSGISGVLGNTVTGTVNISGLTYPANFHGPDKTIIIDGMTYTPAVGQPISATDLLAELTSAITGFTFTQDTNGYLQITKHVSGTIVIGAGTGNTLLGLTAGDYASTNKCIIEDNIIETPATALAPPDHTYSNAIYLNVGNWSVRNNRVRINDSSYQYTLDTAVSASIDDLIGNDFPSTKLHNILCNVFYQEEPYGLTITPTVAMVNGANHDVAMPSNQCKIGGPTGAFSLGGIASVGGSPPTNGKEITLYLLVSQVFTVLRLSAGSAAANQIQTNTGSDMEFTAPCYISFKYDGNSACWTLKDHSQEIWTKHGSSVSLANATDIYDLAASVGECKLGGTYIDFYISGALQAYWISNELRFNVPGLSWLETVANPLISQFNADLGHGVSPNNFRISAQSNTHADTPISGYIDMLSVVGLRSHTTTQLNSATLAQCKARAGAVAYNSDIYTPVFSDGVNWHTFAPPGIITPETYGGIADGQIVADGYTDVGDSTLLSATASWVAADVGKYIRVTGAGPAGIDLLTTIASINSLHSIELTAPATLSVTGAMVAWGTDNGGVGGPFDQAITAAAAIGGTVQLGSGVYCIANRFYPSYQGFTLKGAEGGGTRVAQIYSCNNLGDGKGSFVWFPRDMIGLDIGLTATTLHIDTVPGSNTIQVHASIPAGSIIRIENAGIYVRSGYYIVQSVVGAGIPYTLTLDRPLLKKWLADDPVQVLSAIPTDIHIKNLTISGTGDRYLEIWGGLRCSFENIKIDTVWGRPTLNINGLGVTFELGSRDCRITDCDGDTASATDSLFLVCSGEQCTIERCRATHCDLIAIGFYDCDDSLIIDSHARDSYVGIGFLGDATIQGCTNCSVISGSCDGNQNGVYVANGSAGTKITSVSARFNSARGVWLDGSGGAPVNTVLQGVTATYGAGNGIMIQGAEGTQVSDVDVSNNAVFSFYTDKPVDVSGFNCQNAVYAFVSTGSSGTCNVRGFNISLTSLAAFAFYMPAGVILCATQGYINITSNNSFAFYAPAGHIAELSNISIDCSGSGCYGWVGNSGSTLIDNGGLQFSSVGALSYWFQSATALYSTLDGTYCPEMFGAIGDGIHDDTAAVQSTVSSAINGGTIRFSAKTYKLTSTILISAGNIHIEGAGGLATIIKFEPTADGVCFEFNDGASSLYGCSISSLKFTSTDTTYTKTMVKLSDVRGFQAKDLWASDGTWTGKQSVGIDVCGREEIRTRDCAHLAADIPIRINENPNLSLFSLDHSSIEGCQFITNTPSAVVIGPLDDIQWDSAGRACYRPSGSWIADGFYKHAAIDVTGSDLNNGRLTITAITASYLFFEGDVVADDADDDSVTFTLVGNANICVDHNAILTNCAIRDSAMCLGTSAIHWRTGLACAHSSFAFEVKNCRFEQGLGGSFAFDLGGVAVQIHGLLIENCYNDSLCNGIRLSTVATGTIIQYYCDKGSPGIAFQFDATCYDITRIGCTNFTPTTIVGADIVIGYTEIGCVTTTGTSFGGSIIHTAEGHAITSRQIIGGTNGWYESGAVYDRLVNCEFKDQTSRSLYVQNSAEVEAIGCNFISSLNDRSPEYCITVNTGSILRLRDCRIVSSASGTNVAAPVSVDAGTLELSDVSISALTAEDYSHGIMASGAATVRLRDVNIALENNPNSDAILLYGSSCILHAEGFIRVTGAVRVNFTSGATQAQSNIGSFNSVGSGVISVVAPQITAQSTLRIYDSSGTIIELACQIQPGIGFTLDAPAAGNYLFQILGIFTGVRDPDEVTPEMFGAKGDGSTSDTVAFQAALNDLSSGGTLLVPIPASYYKIDAALTLPFSGIKIKGEGALRSRIHQSHGSAHLFVGSDLDDLQFENLWLTGGGPGTGDGVHLSNTTGTHGKNYCFRNIKIGDAGAIYGFNNGIWLSHCPKPSIRDSVIWQCGTAVKMLGSCNEGVLDNVEMLAHWEAGLHLTSADLLGTTYPAVGVNVRGCTFQQNVVCAVRVENCNGTLIENCYFEEQGAYLAAVTLDNLVWTAEAGAVKATCFRPTGSWLTGFFRAGMLINVTGSDLNNGTWRLFSVTADTLTFVLGSTGIQADADDDSVTLKPSAWDVILDDGLVGAGTVHYGNNVAFNNFRGSTVLTPLYRGAVDVVNGVRHQICRNIHTSNSSLAIEAVAVETEIERPNFMNPASASLTDNSTTTAYVEVDRLPTLVHHTASVYTIKLTDRTLFTNTDGAILECRLPTVASAKDMHLAIIDWAGTAGTNKVTISVTDSTINGGAAIDIVTNYSGVELYCDGLVWRTVIGGLTVFGNGITWHESVTPALYQGTRSSDNPTHDITITSQAAYASATGTNRNSGSIDIVIPAPAAGGAYGSFTVKQDATVRIQCDPSGNIYTYSASAFSTYIGATLRSQIAPTYQYCNYALIYFDKSVAVPRILHETSSISSTLCQPFIITAQSCDGGGSSTGGSLVLRSGYGFINGNILLQDGYGNDLITVNNSSTIIYSPAVYFASSVISPTICQGLTPTNSAVGQKLTIQAQRCTGTTSTGGPLALLAGDGTSANGYIEMGYYGAIFSTTGDVRLPGTYAFNVYTTGGDARLVQVGPSATQNVLHWGDAIRTVTNNFYASAQMDWWIGAVTYLTVQAAVVCTNAPNLGFGATVASPTIMQNNDATAAITGQTMLVHAQDATGTGATVGGALYLRPGHGVTHGALELQDADGSTVRFSASGTGYVIINGSTDIEFQTGGVQRLDINSGGVEVRVPLLFWTAAIASPQIYQADGTVIHEIGDTLLIHAQDETGGGTSVGGNLLLRPGHGVTHGVFQIQDADGTARLTVIASNEVIINGASYVQLGAAGGQSIVAYNSLIWFNVPTLEWAWDAVSPQLIQVDNTTAAATGQTMLIRSQDATGTGATVGGNLSLRPGHGVTHGKLALQDAGGVDRIIVEPNNDVNIETNSLFNVYTSGAMRSQMGNTYLYMNFASLYFASAIASPCVYQEDLATVGGSGADLTIYAQNVTAGSGTAYSGDLGLRGGVASGSGTNKHGNIWFHAAPAAWQSMEKGMFIGNSVTAPTGNPTSGWFIYVDPATGNLMALSADGNSTTLAIK